MKKFVVVLVVQLIVVYASLYSQALLNNVRSYNGNMGASDYYSALVTDNNDNVYAAGYCTDEYSAYILFEKYNSSGVKQWSRVYRSMNNGNDVPVSIAMDSSGGIYVAGFTKSLTASYDFLLIKYNQQGDTLWSRRFNGAMNNDDRPIKVSVDRAGSIVIAGYGYVTGSSRDLVIIKYDANGNQIWQKVYSENNAFGYSVQDFTFDKNNYIYLALQNSGVVSSGIFKVMKLNTAGDSVWIKAISTSSGSAKAVITDDSLNVYATGNRSRGYDTSSIYTVKLNSSGELLWSSTYFINDLHRDFGYRIALDEQGNIYAAGELSSIIVDGINVVQDGYCVIKYTPNGQITKVFDVAKNSPSSSICHLNVLNSSNIYLAYTTRDLQTNRFISRCLKLNQNLDTTWVRTIQGQYIFTGFNSFITDASGNLLCGSAAYGLYGLEAALMKYNSSGNKIWDKYYNSVGFSLDNAIGIGKDNQNNLYVTGINTMDYVILKYNSTFTQQWAVTFSDGSSRNEQHSFSINDSLGNVYLTGTIMDSTGKYYIILLKYNSSGNLEWQRKYENYPALPWGICIDKTGNIIVAGTNWDNANHSALKLLKYTPTGTQLMATEFNAPYNAPIWVYALDTDSENNILVGGSSHGAMTWKFTNNGNNIWERYWVSNYVHSIHKLRTDKKNNVYVCGYTGVGSPEGYNYLTIKYDSAGNQKWVNTFNGIRNGEDFAQCLTVDTLGNTYVTGYSSNQPTTWNTGVVTFKYDSTGNTVWQKEINLQQNGNIEPVMIERDRNNNVYVLCFTNNFLGGYWLTKYSANGDSIWTFKYNSPYFSYFPKAFLLMNEDKIYITGKAYGTNTGYDITTLEIIQTTGMVSNENVIPEKYSLGQNYPNPFNPRTVVSFSLPVDSKVSIKVYDVMGREVQTLVNERMQAGRYEVSFDGSGMTSGVYFFRMKAGNFKETRRMILIK